MHYLRMLFAALTPALLTGMGAATPLEGGDTGLPVEGNLAKEPRSGAVDHKALAVAEGQDSAKNIAEVLGESLNDLIKCGKDVDGKVDWLERFYPSFQSQFNRACEKNNDSLDQSWEHRFTYSDSGSEAVLSFEKGKGDCRPGCRTLFDLLTYGKCRLEDYWYTAKGSIDYSDCGVFKYELKGRKRNLPSSSGKNMCIPNDTWEKGELKRIDDFCERAVPAIKEMGKRFTFFFPRDGYHWLAEGSDVTVYPRRSDTPYKTGWVDFSVQPATQGCDGKDIMTEIEDLDVDKCKLELQVLSQVKCE